MGLQSPYLPQTFQPRRPQITTEELKTLLDEFLPKRPQKPLYNPLQAPAMGPVGSDMSLLETLRLGAIEKRLASDQQTAQAGIGADLAGTQGQIDAMPAYTPRQFTPLTVPDAPVRQEVAMPQREQPRMDPTTLFATAIMGLLAPEGAASFAAAGMRGASDVNERNYADKMLGYQEQSRMSDTTFADALRERQVKMGVDESNLRGREAVDAGNASVVFNRDMALAPLRGSLARSKFAQGSVGSTAGAMRESAFADAAAQGMAEKITRGVEGNKLQLDAEKEARLGDETRGKAFFDALKDTGAAADTAAYREGQLQLRGLGLGLQAQGQATALGNTALDNARADEAARLAREKFDWDKTHPTGGSGGDAIKREEVNAARKVYEDRKTARLNRDMQLQTLQPTWTPTQRFADSAYKMLAKLEAQAREEWLAVKAKRYDNPSVKSANPQIRGSDTRQAPKPRWSDLKKEGGR